MGFLALPCNAPAFGHFLRMNVFPDQRGITFNWPAVLNLVKEMVQLSVAGHA